MNEPIKLPPLPDIPAAICPWNHSERVVKNLLEAYAIAAIEADRQSRDCGQCVPLSTDGKSVFIDGVGDVPLGFGGQARGVNSTHTLGKPVGYINPDHIGQGQGSGIFWVKDQNFNKPVYEAAQSLLQARGEPVAWEFSHNGYWVRTTEPEMHKQMGREIRPLYTAPQSLQIPEGYKAVPAEPTYEMLKAGWAEDEVSLRQRYKAMIEAAPNVTPYQ